MGDEQGALETLFFEDSVGDDGGPDDNLANLVERMLGLDPPDAFNNTIAVVAVTEQLECAGLVGLGDLVEDIGEGASTIDVKVDH